MVTTSLVLSLAGQTSAASTTSARALYGGARMSHSMMRRGVGGGVGRKEGAAYLIFSSFESTRSSKDRLWRLGVAGGRMLGIHRHAMRRSTLEGGQVGSWGQIGGE